MIFSVEMKRSTSVDGWFSPSGAYGIQRRSKLMRPWDMIEGARGAPTVPTGWVKF